MANFLRDEDDRIPEGKRLQVDGGDFCYDANTFNDATDD